MTTVLLTIDNVLAGTAGDPSLLALVNCGDSTHALAYSTSSHTFYCQSISGSGGTVTAVTGVPPIASTGGTTPAISCPTCAIGPGSSTAHHVASFSGADGLTLEDSGLAKGSVVTTVGGTTPISVSGSGTNTVNISCPTCVIGPPTNTVGGIMGMYAGGGSPSNNGTMMPWEASNATNFTKYPQTSEAYFAHLGTYTTGANSANNYWSLYFTKSDGGTNTDTFSDIGRLKVYPSAAAGGYNESSIAEPYHIGQGDFIYIRSDNTNTSTAAPSISTISWDILGTNVQPIGCPGGSGQTIALSTTNYCGPGTHNAQTSDATAGVPIPYAAIAQHFTASTTATQSATGSLVLTMDYTTGGVTSASPLTVTITSSTTSGGLYYDATDTQNLSAGDWISIKRQNNATATSTSIAGIALDIVPNGGSATGMIVFPIYGSTGAAGASKYYSAFGFSGAQATESSVRSVMPRAVTAKNLYCLISVNPTSSTQTATLYKNGSATSLQVSIPTTGCTNNLCFDTTHSVSFAQYDNFSIEFAQASGTGATVSACSMEVD